jgi:predicted nucleic acid-binding protein
VTEYVLVELGSALSKIRDRHLYVPFVEHLLAEEDIEFIPASSDLFRRGLALFAKRPDKDWSLVDCISFVVMRQRRLSDALTLHHHFEQAGFSVLFQ